MAAGLTVLAPCDKLLSLVSIRISIPFCSRLARADYFPLVVLSRFDYEFIPTIIDYQWIYRVSATIVAVVSLCSRTSAPNHPLLNYLSAPTFWADYFLAHHCLRVYMYIHTMKRKIAFVKFSFFDTPLWYCVAILEGSNEKNSSAKIIVAIFRYIENTLCLQTAKNNVSYLSVYRKD